MSTIDEMESRETIPLQRNQKLSHWWTLSCNEDYFGGLKFIQLSFGTLTFIITVALILQIHYGDYQVVPHGSVATDSLECSKIGTKILKSGGNSIDAVIASAFCLSVVIPHLTSLDGDCVIMIYNHRKHQTPQVVDFSGGGTNETSLLPHLVAALGFVHQQFGSMPWRQLIQPAADLARQGFLIPKMLVQAINAAKVEDLYGRLEAGQLLQLENLAKTLDQIANLPEKELYKYVANSKPPMLSKALKLNFYNSDVYVPDTPSTGSFLLQKLEKLNEYHFNQSDTNKTEYFYHVAKELQDSINSTLKYHEGVSTNVAVMDLDENYVALSTGLFKLFGSGEMTTQGYTTDYRSEIPIYCTRLPIIAVDSNRICGRRFVFGANNPINGIQVLLGFLIAGESVTDAIEAPRFNFNANGSIAIEGSHTPVFSDDVQQYFKSMANDEFYVQEPYMSVNVVEKEGDNLNSHSDSRGGGIASRF